MVRMPKKKRNVTDKHKSQQLFGASHAQALYKKRNIVHLNNGDKSILTSRHLARTSPNGLPPKNASSKQNNIFVPKYKMQTSQIQFQESSIDISVKSELKFPISTTTIRDHPKQRNVAWKTTLEPLCFKAIRKASRQQQQQHIDVDRADLEVKTAFTPSVVDRPGDAYGYEMPSLIDSFQNSTSLVDNQAFVTNVKLSPRLDQNSTIRSKFQSTNKGNKSHVFKQRGHSVVAGAMIKGGLVFPIELPKITDLKTGLIQQKRPKRHSMIPSKPIFIDQTNLDNTES